MPTYLFACEKCGRQDELQQSIHKELPTRCPGCRSTRYRQDYQAKRPIVNDGVPRTIMHQADLNAKRMGKELVRKEAEKVLGADQLAIREGKVKRPWWRDSDKPLDVGSIRDVDRFIQTGETS